MKIAVLIADGVKQIMLTPETEHEKQALRFIQPDDKLIAKSKWGTFTDEKEIVGVSVDMCQGGYLRGYRSEESLMFIIEEKEVTNSKSK